jgi:hypothetical protein
LIEQHSNDDENSIKGISPHTITTEWLAQNCYIDTSSFASDFFDNEFSSENHDDSYQYCEVCKHYKLNYRKVHCYTNKGKDRQRITMCIDCLRKYEERRYELFGKPSGVVAITTTARVEEMIMTTLRIILMKKEEDKEKQTAATPMVIIHTATEGDVTINTSEENEDLFYDAVALTYDQSAAVREYFHNDRSRTRLDNKRLWPLRYQAYKELSV